ncbi:hypothetical protein GmHk_16G046824 [Glycine max]|nr:hypothetical protein GmHk_16G046824 [Glycine max]
MCGVSLLVFLLLLSLCVEASVHDYKGEKFAAKGNAFVAHGGIKGIYASVPNLTRIPMCSINDHISR